MLAVTPCVIGGGLLARWKMRHEGRRQLLGLYRTLSEGARTIGITCDVGAGDGGATVVCMVGIAVSGGAPVGSGVEVRWCARSGGLDVAVAVQAAATRGSGCVSLS